MLKKIITPTMLALGVMVFAGFQAAGMVQEAPEASGNPITYKADKAHSSFSFKVRHLGISNVVGEFKDFNVSVEMEGNDLRTLKATGKVATNSLDTGVERRDNDLRSPNFFDVAAYPSMEFTSTAVRNIDGDAFELIGHLTIKDVTKKVVFKVERVGVATMRDRRHVGFSAQTKIDRKAFHLMFDRLTETGGFVVGHDVRIMLELDVVQQL